MVATTLGAPVRTCIGCRQRATTRELLRVTLGTDHDGHPAVVPDPAGTAPGRGAHLHSTTSCLELAERRRAFARALRWAGGQALALDELRAAVGDSDQPMKTNPMKTNQELEQ